ncbi:MAG TPA: OmpA family protein [Chitinophagaceae bacterium]|jgi:outer membrane protein OmpA-like peptidoglycan-associated protein|nr:OmpA family protein [Chitinophagaceae bacterium]
MASKKFILLAGLLYLLTSSVYSQMGSSYDVKDSSVIPAKRMPQHTEFLNGTYNFPAKPRNQWEIGIKGGLSAVSGDVRSWLPTFGGGLHVRKAFGYIFSARLEYDYLTAKGLNFSASQGYGRNPVLRGIYGTGTTPIYYNYKTNMQELSLQGVFTLNNIRFHKSKTGINFYGFAGLGGMIYNTKYNALDGNTPYNYASIVSADYKNRKSTLKALKNLLDGSFETKAEVDKLQPKLFGSPFKPVLVLGAGTQIKLSDRLNLAIEDKFTSSKTDLLDGQQWQENYTGDPQGIAQSRDYDSYNFLSVGLNINLGAKSVQPLWWLNPLDYAYSEIRNPRLMRLPKPVLPDSDGDGVTDQFDQEQTPQGCPVDTHGVSRDTDGDGVPDCKDKELVTPTYCQPVDADGIGKCPCPDSTCFEGFIKKGNDCAVTLGALPSITFKEGSVKISDDAKSLLATVGSRMRNNPECKVVVVGYCSSNKRQQQLSWDRVNAIINYLVEKEGVSNERFIFSYAQEGGDCNTVDIRAAAEGEEGPNTVPAPHPNLRKSK